MRAIASVSALVLTSLATLCPALGLPDGASTNEPERKVILREVALMGATQLPLGEQDAVRTDLLAREYEGPNWKREITERIKDAWQRQGYFRAEVELQHEVLIENPAVLEVVAVANIEEGRLYRFGELRWKNGSAFSPAELRPLFPLVTGEVFNPDKIRQGLESLRKLYAANGYIDFTPVPETEFDDAQAVINLEINLDEGDQFRVGSVEILARDLKLVAKLRSSWKLKPGDVYDGSLVEAFLLENEEFLAEEFSPSECTQIRQDVKAKTVHLRISFDDPLPEFRLSARQPSENEEGSGPAPSLRRRD